MNGKIRTSFICQNCGYTTIKWLGQCPECGSWNSFLQEIAEKKKVSGKKAKAFHINEISGIKFDRLTTDIKEFDIILGGGFVPGEVILLAGEPGIGKSTILLQTAANISKKGFKVCYVSAEESLQQQKMRVQRLNIGSVDILFMNETDFDAILSACNELKPDVIILDSIQSVYTSTLQSAPGNTSQIKEIAFKLLEYSKKNNTVSIIVGHITKEGISAGPKTLEHMVDAVFYFEGDRHHQFRMIRPFKNRFGSTQEVGMFEMKESGLFEIINPSSYLLSERPLDVSGSVISVINEGSRSILVEVQALLTPTKFGIPKRLTIGYDPQRVFMLISVLEKQAGFLLANEDIFINVVGGIKVRETSIDLAIVAALISSFKNKELNPDVVMIGEVGLTGEVRSVSKIEQRVQQAKKMGFNTFYIPKNNAGDIKTKKGIKDVKNIRQLLEGMNEGK